jgi:hypothetical protein
MGTNHRCEQARKKEILFARSSEKEVSARCNPHHCPCRYLFYTAHRLSKRALNLSVSNPAGNKDRPREKPKQFTPDCFHKLVAVPDGGVGRKPH